MESTALAFIGTISPLEIIILFLFMGLPVILWIWALVDLLSSKFNETTDKLIWLIAIVFVPVIGAILYLVIGRKQKATSIPA